MTQQSDAAAQPGRLRVSFPVPAGDNGNKEGGDNSRDWARGGGVGGGCGGEARGGGATGAGEFRRGADSVSIFAA